MSKTYTKTYEVNRGGSTGVQDPGGIPSTRNQFMSTDDKYSAGQLLIGTTHSALPPGAVTSNGWLKLKNSTEATSSIPTVEYGIVVSTVFYPLGVLTKDLGWADLGLIATPGNIYLKASAANTPVDFVLNGIA